MNRWRACSGSILRGGCGMPALEVPLTVFTMYRRLTTDPTNTPLANTSSREKIAEVLDLGMDQITAPVRKDQLLPEPQFRACPADPPRPRLRYRFARTASDWYAEWTCKRS